MKYQTRVSLRHRCRSPQVLHLPNGIGWRADIGVLHIQDFKGGQLTNRVGKGIQKGPSPHRWKPWKDQFDSIEEEGAYRCLNCSIVHITVGITTIDSQLNSSMVSRFKVSKHNKLPMEGGNSRIPVFFKLKNLK
jgi:hypothetical protein